MCSEVKNLFHDEIIRTYWSLMNSYKVSILFDKLIEIIILSNFHTCLRFVVQRIEIQSDV